MTPEESAILRRFDQQFDAIRSMPSPIPPGQRHRHDITGVVVGGYLRISGPLYEVVDVHHYREGSFRWYELELFAIETGETRYVEWEKDDEVEVSLNGSRHTLRDIGVDSDEVDRISDRERGTIEFEGRGYEYDDDYEATFHRSGEERGEKVWFCDFKSADGRWCLTVEAWGAMEEDSEYEVYVSEVLDAGAVEVLVKGAAS